MKTYNEFLNESTSKYTTTVRTYFKDNTVYRMYWVPDYDHNWDDSDLEDLDCIEEHFQHTSKYLYLVIGGDLPPIGKSYYDRLKPNLNDTIDSFLDLLDNAEYPSIIELHEGSYVCFEYDELEHNTEYILADTNDDFDTINIYRKPEEIYPLFINYAHKDGSYMNDFRNIYYDFKNKARDFKKSHLYKSLNVINKFKL